MVCINRPCHFKFFKRCLPQVLRGPFLNTLSQIPVTVWESPLSQLPVSEERAVTFTLSQDAINNYVKLDKQLDNRLQSRLCRLEVVAVIPNVFQIVQTKLAGNQL